ncbi:putative RNA-binding protein EEED8.10 [Ditylenchus destructor]|nr:putative RNA-binding protein EEED8.10 [Ditylenchus destructor]
MASKKFKDYSFECVFCDPKLEMHFTTTQEAMIRHCRSAHNVDEQIKSLFDRCGKHLRHLILQRWLPKEVLYLIRAAPNVQHLRLDFVKIIKMTSAHFCELSQVVPNLKSLALHVSFPDGEESLEDSRSGLIEFFEAMSCLEYLRLDINNILFSQCSFAQFPPNLKYLDLRRINISTILPWIAKGCKQLKGLRINDYLSQDALQAIPQMKSLTYLSMPFSEVDPSDLVYIFEALTELRAIEIDTLCHKVTSAIAQHCRNLEHLNIVGYISPETRENMLHLDSLPNLCSLENVVSIYSKEQTTEFVNRLVSKGNLQYIKMRTQAPLEAEVLLEILRRCRSIKTVALKFGPIDSDFYSKICRVVDEIDDEERQQRELTGVTHPIVEVQYNNRTAEYFLESYKWLRFQEPVLPYISLYSAVCEKWKFGWLGAGKP